MGIEDGGLPWDEPEDMEHFRRTTHRSTVLVGYKTFLTMPDEMFQDRWGIVFSDQHPLDDSQKRLCFRRRPEDAFLHHNFPPPYFLIGGRRILDAFLNLQWVDQLILTRFKTLYQGNVYFPLARIESSWLKKNTQDYPRFTIETWVPRLPC